VARLSEKWGGTPLGEKPQIATNAVAFVQMHSNTHFGRG